MFEYFTRLVERLAIPAPVDEEVDPDMQWLAIFLMIAMVAIVYGAPKEAYVFLLAALAVAVVITGGAKRAG